MASACMSQHGLNPPYVSHAKRLTILRMLRQLWIAYVISCVMRV